jgi:hypothetical protein
MKVSHLAQRALACVLTAALVPLAMAPVSSAQSYGSNEEDGRYSPWRVARLTYMSGEVSVLEPYSDDWEDAELNTPLFEGYEIYADSRDRAEIALGGLAYLRISDGADVTLNELDPGWTKVDAVSGTSTLSIHQAQQVGRYELSTPTAAIVPERPGVFRVDIADNGDTWLTISSGTAQVSTTYGSFQALEGDIVSMSYERPEDVELFGDAARWNADAWDRWNEERDDYYAGIYRRNQPDMVQALLGREDIYGLAELALYGSWITVGSGLTGWQPEVARQPDWAPYQDGYWDYSTITGWTWVSTEPWGWAPYHHGRWYYDDRQGWAWVLTHGVGTTTRVEPKSRYKWQPALVYMWQPPGYNGYAWVPLAPGERFIPFSTTAKVTTVPRGPAVDQRFSPRHLNQRRGILAITTDALTKRQKPGRANPAVLRNVDTPRQPADTTVAATPAPTVAVMPKPTRGPSSLAPARVKPSEVVRRRAVVVDAKAETAAPKTADPTQSATPDPKTARSERKSRNVQLRVERKRAAQAGLGQPGAGQESAAPAPSSSSQSTQAPATQPAPGRRGGRKLRLSTDPGQPGGAAQGTGTSGQQPRTPAERRPTVRVQPGAAQPGAAQPDAAKPGATQPDAAQPDAAQPDSTTPPPEAGTEAQPGTQPGQRRGKGQGKKRRMQTEGQQPPADTTEPKKEESAPPPGR